MLKVFKYQTKLLKYLLINKKINNFVIIMEEIDLHRIRHEEVLNVLIRKIESLWNSNKELRIITGNSNKMKEIVKKILDEYKLEYTEGDIFNRGYIKTTCA